MTRGEVRAGWMSETGAGFGGELVRVDMEEVKVAVFECRDVVEPGLIRGMGGRGEGCFEGLEIKGGEVNDVIQGVNASTEKTVCVRLKIKGTRKLRVGKGMAGGGLVEGDKGLKEASVVV